MFKAFIDYAKWLISVNDFRGCSENSEEPKVTNTNIDVLNLMFLHHTLLSKNNICEYNIKEAISIAQKLKI